jgi:thymidylate synthase
MKNIELQYLELLQDILENGVKKGDRTGTGTISVFGRQIRHKMSLGFPLITTKKMYFKGVITELLWFLRGETNIKYLVENDCHIWDGDAFKNYLTAHGEKYKTDVTLNLLNNQKVKEDFINRIKNEEEFADEWGELGPVYGHQWRNWGEWSTLPKEKKVVLRNGIDQIKNLINDLKKNPDSRRLMVSAWNTQEIHKMVLPPCHYGFQVYTKELTIKERFELWEKLPDKDVMDFPIGKLTDAQYHDVLTKIGVPERSISLMYNQRSVDCFLGLPFNIASYAALLEILAKEVNMVPDELIGNLGDTHLYSNHVEQAKEQISRTPYKLPKFEMEVGGLLKSLMDWKPSDFSIIGYESHPSIKAPLSN